MYPFGQQTPSIFLLDFDMYFCISPDIHISIPMTVFFRNRLLNFPRKRRMNIVQMWSMMFYENILRVHDIFRTSLVIWIQRWPLSSTAYLILESSLTLLIFSSVLKLTCRLFCTLYWPSSLYFLILLLVKTFILGIL